MLPNESAATYVLAKAPVTSSGMAVPKASPMSVLAHEMIVTPATALPHTAVHSSQNWGVRSAVSWCTFSCARARMSGPVLTSRERPDQPSGVHPSAGTFCSIAPVSIMAVWQPASVQNVLVTPASPVPTTYTPSCAPGTPHFTASAAPATTTSSVSPPTSANRFPPSVTSETASAGPRYVGSSAKCVSSSSLTGVASIAPPPKAVSARPVALFF